MRPGPLGRLVRWRIPGLPADVTLRGAVRRRRRSRCSTRATAGRSAGSSAGSGRCGATTRGWTGADAFAALGASRGPSGWLFAHWVEESAEGGSALLSEARVAPVDRGAALRLRALWTVVGPWERLIGGEALARVVRTAEAS